MLDQNKKLHYDLFEIYTGGMAPCLCKAVVPGLWGVHFQVRSRNESSVLVWFGEKQTTKSSMRILCQSKSFWVKGEVPLIPKECLKGFDPSSYSTKYSFLVTSKGQISFQSKASSSFAHALDVSAFASMATATFFLIL